jgi:hypothetical protein
MAVGDFTKQEADVVHECVNDMFNALTKKRQMEFLGELNEILCFVTAAKREAPDTSIAKHGDL